jgi:phospholipid/cholesterol/gamma-HCH transport system substrate-binding protein
MFTRLIALIVVTFVGVYYIAFDAVGLKLTNTPFTVKVVLPAAGGIYPDASVTYRGISVGKVSSLQLMPNEVIANLAINHGEKIPAAVSASVRELTAAAEQYMDLVPKSGAVLAASNNQSGYLHNGSVIPMADTSIPVSIGQLLNTVNSLVNSLHASDLNTLSQALAEGLQNAGQDLRSIIVDGTTLVQALQSAIPGTQELINAGNTDLSTFNGTSNEFASFSANLNLLTQEVAQSNTSLVQFLENGSSASTELDQFLAATKQSTEGLINNFATAANTAYTDEPAFRALFEVLPVFSTDAASVTSGGQIRFELDFNYRNTVCPYTSNMVSPTTLVAVANLDNTCNVQAPDLLQRGADKAPPH